MSHKEYIQLSDDELLLQYRNNTDSKLLGILLQRYTLLLLGVALKYLKDKDLAQDAVQQVFLKAITHFPKGEILNFKGWLYVLVRNHCLQHLRDKNYHLPEAAILNTGDPYSEKEELEWKESTLENMEDALHKLDEPQRKCILLFYIKKQSYKQITEQTGYSFDQVKSYIQNGKRNLKLILTAKDAKRQ